MKKSLFLAIVVLTTAIAQAQIHLDSISNTLSYKKVVEVSLEKEEIKKQTEKWLTFKFADSKEVIELSNEDNIIGNGIFKENIISSTYSIHTKFYFTFDIAFKEGRYKVEFYNLKMNSGSTFKNIPVEYYPNLTKEKLLDIGLKQFDFIKDDKLREQSIKAYKASIETEEAIIKANQYQKDLFALIKRNFYALSNDLEIHLKNSAKGSGW